MLELANVNGTICPVEEARIPAEDRGFLFGDGVYEVIRTYRGRMWAADLHFERLERSLRELEIENYDLGQYRRCISGVSPKRPTARPRFRYSNS